MQIMSSSPYHIGGRKMFEKLAESSGNVVGYKAVGKLTKSDFEGIEPEVKALVEKEGTICILFDMAGYKGETAKGWIADYKFGREFHNKIEKMAVVGDTTWEKWLTQLAKLIYARDSKFFHSSDIGKAWAWLRE
jgi:SpoIIAA-like